MKVIGAGLPRTATLTQKTALEMLGFGPCYHMVEVLENPHRVGLWSEAFDRWAGGRQISWDEIFAGYRSAVDWPASFFYRELMDAYPEAKVLLSVRDSEAWAHSVHDTIWGTLAGDSLVHDLSMARARIDPAWRQFRDVTRQMWARSPLAGASEDGFDQDALVQSFVRYNDQVRQEVPPERLLVWSPSDGWEPLCEFLGVPVPPAPLPRVNDSSSFVDRAIGNCMTALNRWHEEQLAAAAGDPPAMPR